MGYLVFTVTRWFNLVISALETGVILGMRLVGFIAMICSSHGSGAERIERLHTNISLCLSIGQKKYPGFLH